MALAVATSPAHVDGASVSSTVATASFNAAAKTLLVACIGINTSSGGTSTFTVTDNKGLTWNTQCVAGRPTQAQNGLAVIATAWVDTAQTGVVVTVNTAGSTSTTRRPSIDVYVVTGAHDTTPVVVNVVGTSAANAPSLSVSSTVAGSLMFVCATDWQKYGAGTATGFDAARNWDQTGSDGVSGMSGYELSGAPGTWNYTLDAPGSSASTWNLARIEVQPATAPAVNAGADVPSQTVNTVFGRTATEDAGGSTITARTWKIQSGPAGVGTTIGTAAALSWTPTVVGAYTLRYSATNAYGTTTDDVIVTVAAGVGQAFLPELPDARLAIEIAWGADLTASDTTWTWTDITTDVRQDPGIDISLGRSDEASTSQPASCKFTLNNTGAKYSLGPQSPNSPFVRRGTPIRVRVRPSLAAPYTTMFQGNAVSWKPGWNLKGNVPVVQLEAAGSLRRLLQGATPIESPIRRYLRTLSSTVAYWPMEEGTQAQQFESGITGGLPMTWTGTPKLAGNTDFPAARPIPVMSTAILNGTVRAYTPAADYSQSVRLLVSFPQAGTVVSSFAQLAKIYFGGGTAGSLVLYYATGGLLGLKAFAPDGTLLYDTGAVAFLVDSGKVFLSVEMYTSGGNVYVGINQMRLGERFYVAIAGTLAYAGTLGPITSVTISPYGEHPQAAVGHVAVLNTRSSTVGTDLTDAYQQMNGYPAESTTTRVSRLCSENNIPLTLVSIVGDGSSQASATMGPQEIADPIALLRSCELAARGNLCDGLGAGLYYRTRGSLESQAAALTIAASSLQLADGFQPADDDQRLVNKATVTRTGAGAQVAEDANGLLGSAVVGTYQVSDTVNVATDEGAALHASWLVSRGTVVGYRYPTVPIDLRATPSLAAAWLAVVPGSRIDVTGVSSILAGHPAGTVSLLVEGVSHRFKDGEWTGVAKCSPYDVWMIGSSGASLYIGDDDWVMNLDGEGTTTSNITPSSTSVTVSVPAGSPLWMTTANFPNEFPLQMDIGGYQVNVTGISGTSSPQTFTITAPGVTIASGAAVRLWRPMRLGI